MYLSKVIMNYKLHLFVFYSWMAVKNLNLTCSNSSVISHSRGSMGVLLCRHSRHTLQNSKEVLGYEMKKQNKSRDWRSTHLPHLPRQIFLAKEWVFSNDNFVLYSSPPPLFCTNCLLILGVFPALNFVPLSLF